MRDIERMKSSQRTDLQCGNAVNAVIDRAGRTCKVKDVVDAAHVEWLANVFFYKFEPGIIAEMVKIRAAAGQQIIDDHHAPALAEQSVTKVRPEESSATGDERASGTHALLSFLSPFFNNAGGTPSGREAARPTL